MQTEGGAFNVREGNHPVNLAATYGLRSQLEPFVTRTADNRDLDLVAAWTFQRRAEKSGAKPDVSAKARCGEALPFGS